MGTSCQDMYSGCGEIPPATPELSGNLSSRRRRVHTHARTHKHTRPSVCLRTERGVGKQWRTAGTTRPSPCSAHQPRAQFISAVEKGVKGAAPTPSRGRRRRQRAGRRGERTAEARAAAPGWSAGDEPRRWEACARDPGGPFAQGLRAAGTRAPRGARTGHLSSGRECLNWVGWPGWGERPTARGARRAGGAEDPRSPALARHPQRPAGQRGAAGRRCEGSGRTGSARQNFAQDVKSRGREPARP